MTRKKAVAGWVGVFLTIIISGVWAYWGAVENFHEGWYAASLWENLFLFLFQYLLIAIIFILLALIALKWKKIGAIMHLLAGGFCFYFFSRSSFQVVGLLITLPFLALGALYFFGEPKPQKWARRLILFVPIAIILAISIPEGIEVSKRIDDGDFGARVVEGNGVTLIWAPRGPGWPDEGVSWEEALELCKYLSEDGATIMETEQNIWRLPTTEEAVRSMLLHGENAGGVWYAEEEKAIYDKMPDKESPLWDVHSKVIYYWTADTAADDSGQAYIIVYHGGVYQKKKTDNQAYLSFRAVKEISETEAAD